MKIIVGILLFIMIVADLMMIGAKIQRERPIPVGVYPSLKKVVSYTYSSCTDVGDAVCVEHLGDGEKAYEDLRKRLCSSIEWGEAQACRKP